MNLSTATKTLDAPLDLEARQAQILEQMNWWVQTARRNEARSIGKFEDGRWWVYQEMRVWRLRFAFLSKNTLKRIRKTLEKKGLLLRKDEVDPKAPGGVRVWYSIDYDRLEELREAYVAPPDESDDDEGEGDEGTSTKMVPPPAEGGTKIVPPLDQDGTTFTIRLNETSSINHNGSDAPPAGAVGAGSPDDDGAKKPKAKPTPTVQQSYLQNAPIKPRNRNGEIMYAVDDEEGKRRVNVAALTTLEGIEPELSLVANLLGPENRSLATSL